MDTILNLRIDECGCCQVSKTSEYRALIRSKEWICMEMYTRTQGWPKAGSRPCNLDSWISEIDSWCEEIKCSVGPVVSLKKRKEKLICI